MPRIIRKLLELILTLVAISMLTFVAFQLIQGDSVLIKLGMEAGEDEIEAYREEMGFNKSLPERYIDWLFKAVSGDFGDSYQYDEPVINLIKERLPATIWLAVLSFVLIVAVSIPLGIVFSLYGGRWLGRISGYVSQFFMSVPQFFLGMIITLVFGVLLSWFVPGGFVQLSENAAGFFAYMLAPAISVALPKIAMVVRFLRSAIGHEARQGYVRTARGKGCTGGEIMRRHVIKNALPSTVTFLAMIFAEVLAGSVMVEQVFGIPGLGRTLIMAISNRDFPVVQALVLYTASAVVIINMLADLIHQRLDPRVED